MENSLKVYRRQVIRFHSAVNSFNNILMHTNIKYIFPNSYLTQILKQMEIKSYGIGARLSKCDFDISIFAFSFFYVCVDSMTLNSSKNEIFFYVILP